MILKEISIDFTSPVPVYDQIKRNIKHIIAKDLLKMNDPLPSIRELSSFLKINPNTVARAYRELQQEKIIDGRPGKGFWASSIKTSGKEKAELLKDDFDKFMEKAIDMGISPDSVKEMISKYFREEK